LKFSNCLYDELQACLPLLLLLEKQAIERADVDNSSTQPVIRSVLVVLAGGNNHLLFLQLRKSLIDGGNNYCHYGSQSIAGSSNIIVYKLAGNCLAC
jgi:hypothetical protein